MVKQFLSDKTIVPAVIPTAGSVAALTPVEVDGRGWGRAAFIVATGAAATNGTLDVKVQEAATSGGGLTDHSPANSITQLLAAMGASKVVLIDFRINPAKPFLKVTGAVGTATFANSVICVLYNKGGTLPATKAASFPEAIEVH